LNGTFTIIATNGYVPNPGDTFQVLNYPSATSSFTCMGGLDLGSGVLFQPQFAETGLTLLATAYSTIASQPQLFISSSPDGMQITWPAGFPSWTLQSTADLSVPAWAAVSSACGNQAVVSTTNAPQQFFRLYNGN
jgi:hypothetical protein